MSIVITAATGQLGQLVVAALLARGVSPTDLIATGRTAEKLAGFTAQGVRTAVFDYNSPAEGVLSAGDTVLLISSPEVGQRAPQHRNAIEAAKSARVARVVYTSLTRADTSSGVLAPEHKETEAMLKDSGLTYSILRNGWYTENYQPTFEQARQSGSLLHSAAAGRVSAASRQDYAEAAAVVLTSEGHDNATYELGGDASVTMADLAATFSSALGKEVAEVAVSAEQHVEALRSAGLDGATANLLATFDRNTADNTLLVEGNALSTLLGRPTTPVSDSVRSWV